MKYSLHIITRCVHPKDLLKIKESIFTDNYARDMPMWHILFDTDKLKDIDVQILKELKHFRIALHFLENGSSYEAINHRILDGGMFYDDDAYVYLLNGDSTLHPDFYKELDKVIQSKETYYDAIVFGQSFGQNQEGIRKPYRQFIRPGFIDGSQYVFRSNLFPTLKFENRFDADGRFINQIVSDQSLTWTYIDKILHQYANLKPAKKARIPKILYIGEGTPELKSNNPNWWETNELDIRYEINDDNLSAILIEWNPDAIVSCTKNVDSIQNLITAPIEFKSRWIHFDELPENIGELAYKKSMDVILEQHLFSPNNIISYFTPIYNTGDKLNTTYQSLKNQTDKNWEWVIVNDSTDEGYTLKIAEGISSSDPRVKVYDFRTKSGGIIGEAKWRACCMATGEIFAELDHDDYLAPECTEYLRKASFKYRDAGFFYSDAPEVDEKTFESKVYDAGFAVGYGSYRTEQVLGRTMQSSVAPGINPKTVRHIVGIPNHIRAWRRSTYFAAGGHARKLSIADDYELFIRTFLITKMVHIPRTLYIQKLYNDGYEMNTQDLSRADIQRRVKTIAEYYNESIRNRFNELGVEDWAYEHGINTPSRYGEDEGKVNLTYTED